MLTDEMNLCMGCMSKLNGDRKCRCGFDEALPVDSACLPIRTVIAGRYLIGRELSMNGEGIIYIGFDIENEEKVFVEEYMPQKIAKRNCLSGEVVPEPGKEAQFKTLMSDFRDLFTYLRENEAGNECLIPVTDILSDRGTIYAVGPFIKTISYNDYLLHNGGEFSWAQVKKLFMPLLSSISHLHGNGIIHRGISPETIRVNSKGQLLLSYFGTALVYSKNSIIDYTVEAGYAAPEQYSAGAWQGDWTDVYSLAAVMYKSLTGTMPEDAEERAQKDMLCPPRELESSIPENVDDAIMNAMTLDSGIRIRSVDEFKAELLESTQGNTLLYKPQKGEEEKKVSKKEEREDELSEKKANRKIGLIVCVGVGAVLIVLVLFLFRFTEILGLGNRGSGSESGSSNSDEEVISGTYGLVVPNFIGRFRADVEGNETYSQFALTFVEESNPSYSKGMIFDQSEKYRTEVPEGTEIVLKVSTGPENVPMPQCIGKKLEDAAETLNELGIVYTAIPNFSAEAEYGIVFDQSVEAGEDVSIGNTLSKVTIYYSANQNHGSSYSSGGTVSGGYNSSSPGVHIIGQN